jgi:formyltetrahydrofolate-dependent phosphoribosylglycinamide formyltransferase
MEKSMTRIAILISGYGSNQQAIMDAVADGRLPGVQVAVVISNRKDAYGIQRAIQAGVPVVYFPLAPYTRSGRPRQEYDAALAGIVLAFDASWVVQAGWMHVFTDAFLQQFPSRVVNLHPALPGMFAGMHGIQDAYEAYKQDKITYTGVMVHLVPDEAVDAGPVVAQARVSIGPEDTLQDLEARIHATEHTLLVQALHDLLCQNPQAVSRS